MPQRLEALKNWLADVLNAEGYGFQQNGKRKNVDFQLTPASSDASFRRYFRVTINRVKPSPDHVFSEIYARSVSDSPPTLIVMDAPPDKEQTQPFVRIAKMLADIGLNAPRIIAQNTEQGFLLLSDLDNQVYLDVLDEQVLNEGVIDRLYADALDALFVMQRDAPRDSAILPVYDEALLQREMALFRDWYCEQYRKTAFSSEQLAGLDAVFQRLSDAAVAQPQVFVHRDYHSRNLMRTEQNNPGILDFQDAVVGPVTYDLVSLLRDCYIAWPRQRVERWALDYLQRVADAGLIPHESDTTYLRWFDWMGVQRHLKATGIFARLYLRDGKAGYLDDIPRTLNYVHEVSARYPELQALQQLLDEVAE
ncbi:phosphotransferase [Beggiatoa alba]|nr:phosphotransferase [Beggiatoa alba]